MADGISTSTSSDIRTDYMTLLITQLQNQNPLEPMDNDEMSMQLTQFSQLEQLENMSTQFADVLGALDQSYAKDLLGKEISFETETDDGLGAAVTGLVEEVTQEGDDIQLLVGNYQVGLEDVLSVKNP